MMSQTGIEVLILPYLQGGCRP